MSDGWLVIELSENWRLDEKLDFIQNIDMFTDRLTGRGLIIKMYLDIVSQAIPCLYILIHISPRHSPGSQHWNYFMIKIEKLSC